GPTMPVMALVGLAATILGIMIIVGQLGDVHVRKLLLGVLLTFVAGPIGLVATLLLILGTACLEIDPAAGTARFVRAGRVVWRRPLTELGAMSISGRGARFSLRIDGDLLFEATTRQAVTERMAKIERLVEAALRQPAKTPSPGSPGRDPG
ncbi:MAG TPA: hypothetical protein VLB44_24930, partial [Kofleriaceae bacterium]|nr:hypothetical protein [Kofleriaceae bacterium]